MKTAITLPAQSNGKKPVHQTGNESPASDTKSHFENVAQRLKTSVGLHGVSAHFLYRSLSLFHVYSCARDPLLFQLLTGVHGRHRQQWGFGGGGGSHVR
jgi:hypothetical protein